MPTWDQDYLDRLTKEAEREIVREVSPIYAKESIAIVSGTATYTLPNYARNIIQVTYQGKPVDPLHQSEAINLNKKYVTDPGEPRWYIRSPEDFNVIRLIPVPNENISADPTDDVFDSDIIDAKFIVSFFREADTSRAILSLPDYVARRLVKHYILKRAFLKEGKGQNLKAAEYYESKYLLYLDLYKKLRERYWMGKKKFSTLPEIMDRLDNKPRYAADFTIPKLVYPIPAGDFRDSISFSDEVSMVLS